MRILIVCFFIFTFGFSFARANPSLGESSVCGNEGVFYKGIYCCNRAVSHQECMKLVDDVILPKMASRVELVQANYLNKKYDYGRVPNCFWSALEFHQLGLNGEPHFLEALEFIDFLNLNFNQKPFELAGDNDVLAFVSKGEMREDLVGENGAPYRAWFPITRVEHAAVDLGDGLLFQKENIGTGIFSIDTIAESVKIYERAFNKSPQFRGTIELERWEPIL